MDYIVMRVLLTATILLLLSFTLHVILWRRKIIARTTNTLFFIFFGVLAFFLGIYLSFDFIFFLSIPKFFQFILLYSSSVLVYIILYSAIEQQSPTLAIIKYIQHHSTCDKFSLYKHLNEPIIQRISLMKKAGLIFDNAKGWHLTKKGYRVALLFEWTAILFSLKKGG